MPPPVFALIQEIACYNRFDVSQVYCCDEQMSQLCSRFVSLCLMVIVCLQIFLLICHRFPPQFNQEVYLPPSVLISNVVIYMENYMITGISSNIS